MITCPFCNAEIEEGSHYCDQCGKRLMYCSQCGRVGDSRRCTHCGGLMVTPEEIEARNQQTTMQKDAQREMMGIATGGLEVTPGTNPQSLRPEMKTPQLVLSNSALNIAITGINGAIIGRRQGPYTRFFATNRYVSGVHAQIFYRHREGWCVMDKYSSNGTTLNRKKLMPDVCYPLRNGDVLAVANVKLEVMVQRAF